MIAFSFVKMHALGNDFVIVDNLAGNLSFDFALIPTLAHRHVGIGFDQLLFVEMKQEEDLFCRIFNADGSEAEQCGNGLRCVAQYLKTFVFSSVNSLTLSTKAGSFDAFFQANDFIAMTLGKPKLLEKIVSSHPIQGIALTFSAVSMGNPHAIIFNQENFASFETASAIAAHPLFPSGANVGFATRLAPSHIKLQTYERGAGKTYACGSNACAAVIAGIQNGWLENAVEVEFELGSVYVTYDASTQNIWLKGPASLLYKGEWLKSGN